MPLSHMTALNKDRTTSGRDVFQHRHFAEIARIIHALPAQPVRWATAEHFADYLADSNPRFDRARFMRACTDQRGP